MEKTIWMHENFSVHSEIFWDLFTIRKILYSFKILRLPKKHERLTSASGLS